MSTKPTDRRRTPEERPRQILDAALAVFGEQGLAGARVEEIADRAGISKGTVYLYFPSKEEIFREVVRSTWIEMLDSVAALPRTDDALADLESICRGYWAFLRSPTFATAHRLVMAEIHAFPEIAREYAEEVRQPILQAIQDVLGRAEANGTVRPGDNLVRARMLMALLWQHGIWCARRHLHTDLDERDDAAVLTEIITFFEDAITLQS